MQYKGKVDSFMHYMKDNNPVMKGWFKIAFLMVIASVYMVLMILLGTGTMEADPDLGAVIPGIEPAHSHMSIISIQVLEPYLTLMMFLLIIKGKKSFFWWGLAGGSMLMISQIMVGLWMGVIKGGVFIILNFITYLRWGNQPSGPLVVKKADWKLWTLMIVIITAVTVIPGYFLSPSAGYANEMFMSRNDFTSYLDSLAFALAIGMTLLNIGKFREARLFQLLNQFVTPTLFILSGQYIYAAAGIMFIGVSIAGMSDWYIRARKAPEEQIKMAQTT